MLAADLARPSVRIMASLGTAADERAALAESGGWTPPAADPSGVVASVAALPCFVAIQMSAYMCCSALAPGWVTAPSQAGPTVCAYRHSAPDWNAWVRGRHAR